MSIEIIAECAQGYEGNPHQALLLAKGAVRADADAVKFQLIYADELAVPGYKWYDLFKTLEMELKDWQAVADVIHGQGKRLYFDIFGQQSLQEALSFGADGVKIHATDFFNDDLVKEALGAFDHLHISLGGIKLEELLAFIDRHDIKPDGKVCFMFGFQAEPTLIEDNHLMRLHSYQQHLAGHPLGFMDHADGDSEEAMTLALMALPLGITCIEKHLTLDRSLELEDYVSAITSDRFADFVTLIRRMAPALGSDSLELTAKELKYRNASVKVAVANSDLAAGTTLTAGDIGLKRVPEDQLDGSITSIDQIVGKRLTRDLKQNQAISQIALA